MEMDFDCEETEHRPWQHQGLRPSWHQECNNLMTAAEEAAAIIE